MRRELLFALFALAACSRATSVEPPPPSDSPPPPDYAVAVRPAHGPLETAMLASRPFVFDPALDCVAAGLLDASPRLDPRAHRHRLPIACGSPLLVVDARIVEPDGVDAALAELTKLLPGDDPIALGTASLPAGALLLVAARRTVELALPRAGATQLSGRLLVQADALRLYQATPAGVEVRDVPLQDGRFALALDPSATAADLELALVVGRSTGPAARVRLGDGAGLVDVAAPSLALAVAEARRRLGRPPLAQTGDPGDCAAIPPAVDGVDVTDRARCSALWSIAVEDAATELGYRPLELHALLEPDAAIVQVAAAPVGPREAGVALRVLRRFQALTPAAGRELVLALMRERWPALRERPAPAGELAAILDALRTRPDDAAMATLKPGVDRIAARWTTTRKFYSGLASSRDLAALLQLVRPAVAPLAVDLAFTQARGTDGAMRHFIAFVLELPPDAP
ncbi:hypothetical protein [Nannocystis punicea]|uniref:Uncharacterized protein n=1 Tax=Nannocystis punicea TaxID=2995304 RepID=A0ABY7HEH5_9BACT|nr:hypothetical protein [Nannocystis poenicansa]WAS97429.1 hypothetical protein O0S08_14880 [Nannocystis poenicansa]